MIRRIERFGECREFVESFRGDPCFSDPMLTSDEQLRSNLIDPIERDGFDVFGVYRDGALVGLFSFFISEEERYLEMLVGLSRERSAYVEALDYLERRCPGYAADLVFNPANHPLRELLSEKGAEFEPEQRKFRLREPSGGIDTSSVEQYSERYAEQYLSIHSRGGYWTAEKVAAAQDRFRTLLAIRGGAVVGYIDVTRGFAENEPYDLFVLEKYRRQGYGRALLAKAIELNRPAEMSVLLDADDIDTIRLYESMGFVRASGEDNLTAHLSVRINN